MPPWRGSGTSSSELGSRSRRWGYLLVSRSGSAVSAHALRPSDTPPAVRVLRNVDLIALALALVLFLAAGFPIAGWLAGAGAWIAQRLVSELAVRRAKMSEDPRTRVGLLAGSIVARGWLVAGIIFAVGLSNSHAGLGAAVLFLAVFTLYFSITMALRPFDQQERREGPR